MKRTIHVTILTLAALLSVAADAPKAPLRELDLGQKGLLFDQWFLRFGYRSGRTVVPERNGVRFQIPPTPDASMAGYYSSFELSGDFEVEATFEVITMSPPTKGYGVSIGMTIDTDGPDGSVTLIRGLSTEKVSQFIVVRATPGESTTDPVRYDTTGIPTTAQRGRLVIRREKQDLICFVADKPTGELRELKRLPFTNKRIRYLKLHADCGGSPTGVSGRLSSIHVRADEIVGGLTQQELDAPTSYWWWWIPITVSTLVVAIVIRRKRKQEESDDTSQ